MIKAFNELLHPRNRNPSEHPASEELRLAREALSAEIDGVFNGLKRSLYIEKRVLGLSIFDTGYRVAGFAAAAISGLAVALIATFLVVTSARRGMQMWTNDAWWSDLVLAVALLALLIGIAHAVRRWVHRSTLAETRRELDRRADSKPAESMS
ncbi:MAG: hypothetical protein SGI72_11540 [Planctomycetota bacterium]|nr:hypothetical protein [Planctomycetota bacterium]